MDNNNNSVVHNPSENNDGGSIGDIDVDDIPKLYNFLCHAPTGGTDSNHCWCFDNNPASNRNNMINNNDVGPSPLCSNEGSSIADDHIFLNALFYVTRLSVTQLAIYSWQSFPPAWKGEWEMWCKVAPTAIALVLYMIIVIIQTG